MNQPRTKDIYRYAFLAFYGRIDEPEAVYVGEIEGSKRNAVIASIGCLMRRVYGKRPRDIKISQAQYSHTVPVNSYRPTTLYAS